jgi:hypothetical protein
MIDRIGFDVFDTTSERLPVLGIEFTLSKIVVQRFLDLLEIGFAAQRTAANRNDATFARELSVAIAVVQRRQQLAHRKVTGSAKYDEVEKIDRY